MSTKPTYFNFEPQGSDDQMLLSLQRETFDYFLHEISETTGLIADKNQPGSPSSIAVVGMGISSYIIGIASKFISRQDAVDRILKILRFFHASEQSPDENATGYKGFFYHFLHMNTGKRAWRSELSTIDTCFLMAGVLSAVMFFNGDDEQEQEIRKLGEELYLNVDWKWALNKGETLTHGWKPESGFLKYRWNNNYGEALLLYVMAMGSATHPIASTGYDKWTSTFSIREVYSLKYVYAGPLFIHQFSHLWIDFRKIRDAYMREAGFDYFENSRRATLIHRLYAIENTLQYAHYGPFCWGQTASDGPGRKQLTIEGIKRVFYGYKARGAPFGPDDGTISPWAVVASLPFAPEVVIETTRHAIEKFRLKPHHEYGFDASFNPTYPGKKTNSFGWVSPWKFGLNQGPVIMMISNHRSELIWKLMKQCSFITKGLKSAGFKGGWI